YLVIGEAYLQARKPDAGLKPIQQAVTLAPDSGPAHRLLARALLQQNRIAEAIDEYQRAHRLDPNLPGLEEELALVEASHE
ncbi:hypothetical protein DF186_22875, partial [Enterococcus hirae]